MTTTHPWPVVSAIGALPTWALAAISVLMICGTARIICLAVRQPRLADPARTAALADGARRPLADVIAEAEALAEREFASLP